MASDILKHQGYIYNPSMFGKEFLLDTHLHHAYFHPKFKIPCELHWAIDHPFSNYDIKIDDIFSETHKIFVGKTACYDTKSELRFILLLVHIQKHLPYINYLYGKTNLADHIIDNGELLHILDAYLYLKKYENKLDWNYIIQKSISWNADSVVYTTLKTIENIFGINLPVSIFKQIEAPKKRIFEKYLFEKLIKPAHKEELKTKFYKNLSFTPKRLPDLYTWFFPDKTTIIRKYTSYTYGEKTIHFL